MFFFMDGPQDKPKTPVNLRVASINIENIKANKHYLQQLATTCNITCIQEHWLHRFEKNNLHENSSGSPHAPSEKTLTVALPMSHVAVDISGHTKRANS